MTNTNDLLTRRVQQILPTKEGLEKLITGKKIRLYQGFDPSRPNLHIGHLVGLLQLKAFQDAGHEVIFLIGDFTGMIGDPTDKSATRPKLTHEDVLKNAETYKQQAGKILRFEGENAAKIMFNYDWNSKLNFPDVLELASNLTVQQMIERDMFQNRLKENKPIYLHEFLYPLIQGYDSVAMDVDLEVGGNDQMFNLMIGRTLMKSMKGKEKYCLTTKLLVDSSGNKIGKTTGNAVELFGKPEDLFGGLMSVPDDAIENMLVCATEIPMDQVRDLINQIPSHPMDIKKKLAWEITKMCNTEEIANKAQAFFENTVQNKELPADIAELTIKAGVSILEVLKSAELGVSNSDIKRTLEQGGVEIEGVRITNPTTPVSAGTLKFGKRTFRKLIIK
jgi:tyrosyl-tRNA synthetase